MFKSKLWVFEIYSDFEKNIMNSAPKIRLLKLINNYNIFYSASSKSEKCGTRNLSFTVMLPNQMYWFVM